MATTWFYNETRWDIKVKQQDKSSWTTVPANGDTSYTTTSTFDYFLINQSHTYADYIRWHSNLTTHEVESGVPGYILSDDNQINDSNGTIPSYVSFNEYNYDACDCDCDCSDCNDCDNSSSREWSKLCSTIYDSDTISFDLDAEQIGWMKFVAPADGTLTVYTTGNYNMYGWLELQDIDDGLAFTDYGTGYNTLEGSYLTRANSGGSGNNFKFTYSVTEDTAYLINIHERYVGSCSGKLYVEFALPTCTITPYASTGIASVSGGGVIQYGSSTSITATPKNGYQFSQWVDEAATPYTSNPLTISNVTSDQKYWASAEPITYDITYVDAKQGTTTATIRKTYTIETATFSLHTLTKTGYTFNGWYTTSTFTGTAVTQITQGSTEDKTFYAKWTPVEYSITYNLNSGSLPTSPTPLTKYTIETATYTLPTPTRTNYEFQGWYENSGLTGTAVTQITQGSTGNKTYYAKWKLKNYTVSYNMNGGSGTITSHYSDGTTFTPSTTIPTKTGEAFIGWNTSSSATTAQYHPGVSASIGSDLTLYAIWKPLITFKWTDNNYETHNTSQYLSDLSSTKDIPSNYHVSQAEVQRLINLIKTYCNETITIDEKRLATLYNNIATALRNSSTPEHHSGSTAPTTSTLPDVTAGNAITVDDFLKLENAFNNRKFI